jgi:8-oxo-dGTP pyrophosphatase MutT (NUDIX family)
MVREISAGGVVVRKRGERFWIAAIEPHKGGPSADSSKRAGKTFKRILALPKGLVDPNEKPLEAALREVYEETGVTADHVSKLGDVKYVYTRAWGDRQRVFKIVNFYLMRYRSGRINDIAPEMRIEVARARWIPLEDAPTMLAYKGDKEMAQRAREFMNAYPDWAGDKLPS